MKQNKKIRVICLFLTGILLVLSFFNFPDVSKSQETFYAKTTKENKKVDELSQLYALSACLMDADSGRILFEKDGDVKRANASTTKVLTLIVTLENADLEETVTISEYAARQPDVQLNANTGEEYKLRDLCYAMMLESYNDVAVAIAEHVAGSVEDFAVMMNKKAEEIGCLNSHFITPNGLDAEDAGGFHGTTAEDLSKILSYCVTRSEKKEAFLEITRANTYQFTDLSGKRSFTCHNHNAFLTMMDGALSGKTGFTGDAGYCYVGALRQDDRTFVVALLGCGWPNNKTYKWCDMKKIMNYALAHYRYENIAGEEIALQEISVKNAENEAYSLREKKQVALCMEKQEVKVLKADWEKIEVKAEYPKEIEAPVTCGQILGYVSYYLDGNLIKEIPVKAKESVKKREIGWFRMLVWKKFSL
ncbi:MAG: D-alanyl-D-alanine carboxypeptidase family protein [Lachnospiraceae bacterium]|nr:D-alanyl-D-alanine carboxypeptidase family protein [Lachnospiraceae bacterium]